MKESDNIIKTRGSFEGWYFKQQNGAEAIALIPALHVGCAKDPPASLQIITDTQVFQFPFQRQALRVDRKKLLIRLGENVFSPEGCTLNIQSAACSLKGHLRFGPFHPPSHDIMGPFRFVPFMECRHLVCSMYHHVDGLLTLNGKPIAFENGSGYLEGDRGTSFPKRYLWTQCCWNGNSIMLSVAEIPFCGMRFIGCIGLLFLDGKEYRIATYRGVKLLHVSNDTVLLRQGTLTLEVKALQTNSQLLRAPHNGSMMRTIHESLSCHVQYTCRTEGKELFRFISDQASFENNWTPSNNV